LNNVNSNQFYTVRLGVHFELNPLIEEHLSKLASADGGFKNQTTTMEDKEFNGYASQQFSPVICFLQNRSL
jgi:hypothetical protein